MKNKKKIAASDCIEMHDFLVRKGVTPPMETGKLLETARENGYHPGPYFGLGPDDPTPAIVPRWAWIGLGIAALILLWLCL